MEDETNVALMALRQSMQIEVEGHEFYAKASQATKDENVKQTFVDLAQDEDNHLRLLRRQYDSLTEGKKWASLTPARAERIDLNRPLFPKGKEALEKAVITKTNETDALLFGLDIEMKSYELYCKAAKRLATGDGEKMYQFLAGEEKRHFEILMMRYENIVGPIGWQY